MPYMITGATGLLGSRIVRNLVKRGEQVFAYDIHPDTGMLEMVLSKNELASVKIIAGDIIDFDHLFQIAKENKIEVIFHYAAILGPEIKINPRKAALVDAQGTVNVFEVARVLKLKKVVWASSSTVFSPRCESNGKYISNDHLHHPIGLYGACKSFGEYIADYYFQEFNVDITALRYGTLYGAGQQRGSSGLIVRELMLNPAVGKPGKVQGKDDTLAWTYVDDAASAAILASQHQRNNTGAFNIMGQLCSVREIANYVKELVPEADIELLPVSYSGPRLKLDSSITEKELGYVPVWSVKQGVKETINMERWQHGMLPV